MFSWSKLKSIFRPQAVVEQDSPQAYLVNTIFYVMGITMILSALILGVSEYMTLTREHSETIESKARILGESASAAMYFNDRKGLEDVIRILELEPGVLSAKFVNNDGEVLASLQQPSTTYDSHFDAQMAALLANLKIDSEKQVYPVMLWDKQAGALELTVSLSPIYARLIWHMLTLGTVCLTSFFATWLIFIRMRRSIDQAEGRLDYLAYHDTVTHLPNRHAFNEELAQALQRAMADDLLMGVVFFDLDNFKLVNDTLGHHAGDELLRALAQRLMRIVRGYDMVFRLGGDEFALLLPDIQNREQAEHVAERLLGAVSEPVVIDGRSLFVSASIGYCMFPDDGRDAESLLKNADTAMYHAKSRGKNTWQGYYPELKVVSERRMVIESELRQALDHPEQFHVVYQPQVSIRSGVLTGVEALLRWDSPKLGKVSPAEFIEIAEETGLIVRIGSLVLEMVCTQVRAWADQLGSMPIPVSVNLSPKQFADPALPETIIQILEKYQVNPAWIELEITESALMANVGDTVVKLNQLHAAGLRFAIDDFGTGYSSMNHLKRFPVDKLKIDRSFVEEIPFDRDACLIASGIIALARSLGLSVVAEGVESIEQQVFLQDHGCETVQGFLISAPVHSNLIDPMLHTAKLKAERQAIQGDDGEGPMLHESDLLADWSARLISIDP